MTTRRLICIIAGIVVGILASGFIIWARAEASETRWRCWAVKVVPHGEARCAVVFDADRRDTARRYAVRMCEDECGGKCVVDGCAPFRGGE